MIYIEALLVNVSNYRLTLLLISDVNLIIDPLVNTFSCTIIQSSLISLLTLDTDIFL